MYRIDALCIDTNNISRRFLSRGSRDSERLYLCRTIDCRPCVDNIDIALLTFFIFNLCEGKKLYVPLTNGINRDSFEKFKVELSTALGNRDIAESIVRKYLESLRECMGEGEYEVYYRVLSRTASEIYYVVLSCRLNLEEAMMTIDNVNRDLIDCLKKISSSTANNVNRELMSDLREWIVQCLSRASQRLGLATLDFNAFEVCEHICRALSSKCSENGKCVALYLCKLCDPQVFHYLFGVENELRIDSSSRALRF